jgi:DNA-binding PadR family transcriptional regulator
MREPTVYLLTALSAGSRHGYALISEVADLSGGRVRLRPGTLYGALDRLVDEGLVAVAREEVVDGRLRRYYDLTAVGARALAEQAARLRQVADAAAAALRVRGVTA